jgi:hypothetical protein
MSDFIDYRMTVLDEIIRHDGLKDHASPPLCSSCLDDPGVYRCLECSAISSYCTACIVSRHDELPLHRIEVCLHVLTFSFFRNSSVGMVRRVLPAHIAPRAGLFLLHWSPTHTLPIPEFHFPKDPRHRPQWSALHQCPVLRM